VNKRLFSIYLAGLPVYNVFAADPLAAIKKARRIKRHNGARILDIREN
jgi:hypothetical protein